MTAIKKWIKKLFYMQNNDKVSDKSLSRLILSSIAGILICGVCLASLTWAWFSGSATSISNNITAANFSAGSIFEQNGTVIEPEMEDGSYKLNSLNSGVYTVTINAYGSASTGYCNVKLKLSDNDIYTYHTVQLYPGDGSVASTVKFTVNAPNTFYLTVTPQWGTYAKPEGEALIGNSEGDIAVIHLNTRAEETQTYRLTEAEQSYPIKQGDTLTKIAQMYGLYGSGVDILSTYNNIKNPDKIQAGAILKIPPASYTIPAPTTTETTTAETTTAETTTAETTAAETTTAETTTAETTAAETTTAETTTAETTTAETTTAETTTVETTTAETTTAETTTVETTTAETTTAETTTAETTTAETTTVETTTVETTTAETTTAETTAVVGP